jgi:hypothetical protein
MLATAEEVINQPGKPESTPLHESAASPSSTAPSLRRRLTAGGCSSTWIWTVPADAAPQEIRTRGLDIRSIGAR